MPKKLNLIGKKFGRLTVLKEDIKLSKEKKLSYWICQCDCGNYKTVSSTNLIQKRVYSCGCITTSIGEQNIEKCLKENNVLYKKQFSFKDLPKRYFDFAIFDTNNQLVELIEFDGPQHYDSSYNWYSKEQVSRDKEKDLYCKQHNIKLIRIPYHYRDMINLQILNL